MQAVQFIASMLVMILFSAQLNGMEDKRVTYHKESYICKSSHIVRVIARCNGHEVGRLVPYEGICNQIGELWVVENMRNKGIGKTLLSHFINYCKQKKWEQIVYFMKPDDPIKKYVEKLVRMYPIITYQLHPHYVTYELKLENIRNCRIKI